MKVRQAGKVLFCSQALVEGKGKKNFQAFKMLPNTCRQMSLTPDSHLDAAPVEQRRRTSVLSEAREFQSNAYSASSTMHNILGVTDEALGIESW
jgi:hypothetical protein